MVDGSVTIRTRKYMTNRLLCRYQESESPCYDPFITFMEKMIVLMNKHATVAFFISFDFPGVKWWLMSSTQARLQCPRQM